jgi:hypothetical protein
MKSERLHAGEACGRHQARWVGDSVQTRKESITCTKDVLGRIFEEDFRMRLQESSEPLQLVHEVRFESTATIVFLNGSNRGWPGLPH